MRSSSRAAASSRRGRCFPAPAGRVELETGLAAVARAEPSLDPADTDELLLIGSILRRPPPELQRDPARSRSGEPRSLAVMASVATATFADRLAEAVERKRSQLVVGLDPRLDLLPVELRGEAVLGRGEAANAVARFCCGIVDAVAPVRRRGQAAGRVLRGARRRRDRRARARLRLRARGRAARDRRRASAATSARRRARTPPPTSSRGTTSRRSPTRSPSTPTSAATPSSRSCRRAGCTARASSASCARRTPAQPTSRS